MSNKTVINPNVNATVINSEMGQATAINPNIAGTSKKLLPELLLLANMKLLSH